MDKSNKKIRRKICFVITSFIHYARNFLILEELRKRSDVDLHIIVGGAALLSKYSSNYAHVKEILESEGFKNIYETHFNLEGDSRVVKAKTAGLGIIEFSLLFNNIQPDVVVIRGDRFEILSAATAASYMNIPIAHIEGGDLSGTLDESIRHSITKLSHIHFSTNEPAKRRILKMGERNEYVFNFGSPDVEVAQKIAGKNYKLDLSRTGSGAEINTDEDFLMVMYHPVNSELDELKARTRKLLKMINEINIPTIWFWPNFDAGAEEISHEIRHFKDNTPGHKIRFMRYLPPKEFLTLLKKTKCLIGNSSAGMKESSYLGTPVINIGNRQNNRLRAENVIDVEENNDQLVKIIKKQIKNGSYKPSHLYSVNNTSKNIARTLATISLYTQKNFVD